MNVLVMYAEFAFLVLFLIPGPFSFGLFCDTLIFNGCAFMALLSHFRAMTTGRNEKKYITSRIRTHIYNIQKFNPQDHFRVF